MRDYTQGMAVGIVLVVTLGFLYAKSMDAHLTYGPVVQEVNGTKVYRPVMYCMSAFDEVPVYEFEVLPRSADMEETDKDNILADEKRVWNLRDCSETKYLPLSAKSKETK